MSVPTNRMKALGQHSNIVISIVQEILSMYHLRFQNAGQNWFSGNDVGLYGTFITFSSCAPGP